jgi:acetylornithine deacetylase
MDTGISATILLAPLLAEITEYARQFRTDQRFMDADFQPPTNGFNITINDGGCAANVTASKTVVQFNFRTMPAVATAGVRDHICARAQAQGFEVETSGWEAVDTPRSAPVIRLGEQLTGLNAATVPYGTDALVFQAHVPLLILGPGDIAQAHTIGEWVEIEQLQRAVPIYEKFIGAVCA